MCLVGALLALLICLGLVCFGRLAFSRWTASLDPCARFGVEGLLGLGAAGTATFLIGLASTGVAAWLPLLLAMAGIGLKGREVFRTTKGREKPQGAEWIAVLALGLLFLMAFVVLLIPSTTSDWDSIAYHMALPKLYNSIGHVQRMRFVSHSAFPESVEMLFLLPIKWGLQSGAKAFLLGYSALGGIALFGLTRERYGRIAGWWTAVAFAATPVVLWESASAYIDVAHGLFAGLGAILALRSATGKDKDWILAGLLLGFACGTKYTGLQSVGVVLTLLVVLAFRKSFEGGFKPVALVAGVAFMVGCPWYVKNVVTTGNPVYPFLYEQFKGVDWDQKRADAYRDEQLTFGVGVTAKHKDWPQLGHAILGLDYQPGRYVNASEPLGAVGVAFFAGLLFWAIARKPNRLEAALLAFTGLSFILWFALSQQSRYATTLAIPASLMLGGAVVSGAIGRIVAIAAVCQTLYTGWLFKSRVFDDALPVAIGKVDPLDYLHQNLKFSYAAEAINALRENSKVALYDQVFGYYLNRDYFWANPGHSTLIPYEGMRRGSEFTGELRKLGFTHVYLQFVSDPDEPAFLRSLATGQPLPLDLELRWRQDWKSSWKVYLLEAKALGELKVVNTYPAGDPRPVGILFEIKPK